MTTIIREELEQIIFFAGEATCHPDPNYWLEFEKLAQPGVVLELARIALASLEAKPVAWTDEEELRDANVAGIGYLFGIEKNANKFADPRRQIMLYRHAQPVPVVPPAIEPDYEVIKAILPTSNPDEYACCIAADMWNACRAVMLNRPSSSQASMDADVGGVIKQPSSNSGWIPVSERVPEESGRYWCYVEEQNSLGKSHYQWNCSWNGEAWSDKALSGRVTHWMPLPAAPQQEVK